MAAQLAPPGLRQADALEGVVGVDEGFDEAPDAGALLEDADDGVEEPEPLLGLVSELLLDSELEPESPELLASELPFASAELLAAARPSARLSVR
jgi:hypothetical protein